MILGLNDEQLEKAVHQTQADIDESNRINQQYLFECQLADLRCWKYKKAERLLAEIEVMFWYCLILKESDK